jgi:phage terminase large subunit GpA-like protein
MTTLGHKEKLWRTTEIHDKLIDVSTIFDDQTKQAFKTQSKFIRDILTNNPKANSYQLRTLTSELLTYWNESIKPETEAFWTELRKNDIDFERKEPLKFALTKGRFRNVEQGMDARNYWTKLKMEKSIIDNYTQAQIQIIDKIILDDEQRRHDILKKCLIKKAIPQTQYLKFGECMAYFANCQLFDKYFSTGQIEELYQIWKNFKSD